MPIYVRIGDAWIVIKEVPGEARGYGMVGEAVNVERPRGCIRVPVDSGKVSRLIAELVRRGVGSQVFVEQHRNGVDYYASICGEDREAVRRDAKLVRRAARRLRALLEDLQ